MGDKRPQRLVSRIIEVEEQPKKKQKAEEGKAMPFGAGKQLVVGGNFHYQAFELEGAIYYRGYYVKVVPKDKDEERYVVFIKDIWQELDGSMVVTVQRFYKCYDLGFWKGIVEDKDKVLLDSREKIEFYRTKMQDLVLYQSGFDNRLSEITERAMADKREVELLGKKYEEKYKQVAETASKLTIEEAVSLGIQKSRKDILLEYVKNVQPEFMELFVKWAPQQVVDAMRQTVTNMIGTLPQFFAVTVTTVAENLARLMYSVLMTGYMFSNAQCRLELQQSLDQVALPEVEEKKELTNTAGDDVVLAMNTFIKRLLAAGQMKTSVTETSAPELAKLLYWLMVVGYSIRNIEVRFDMERVLGTSPKLAELPPAENI
ncbi:hypothetical protein RHGRI_015809 [Rhododendron griersonianum]|uniref:Uncharacterized protein n=1 Tax=Rhododendron griersonianum TaxID=479676 RepID=A0AAV6JSA6_9ERIC|nr:hypothetical protein RHGRI_015809 [Rhododendron griersonianum]